MIMFKAINVKKWSVLLVVLTMLACMCTGAVSETYPDTQMRTSDLPIYNISDKTLSIFGATITGAELYDQILDPIESGAGKILSRIPGVSFDITSITLKDGAGNALTTLAPSATTPVSLMPGAEYTIEYAFDYSYKKIISIVPYKTETVTGSDSDSLSFTAKIYDKITVTVNDESKKAAVNGKEYSDYAYVLRTPASGSFAVVTADKPAGGDIVTITVNKGSNPQSTTFTASENPSVRIDGITGDVTVNIIYSKPDDSAITMAANSGVESVKIGDTTYTSDVSSPISFGNEASISITPKNNKRIVNVSVSNSAGNLIELDPVNGTFRLKLNNASTSKVNYVISVQTEDIYTFDTVVFRSGDSKKQIEASALKSAQNDLSKTSSVSYAGYTGNEKPGDNVKLSIQISDSAYRSPVEHYAKLVDTRAASKVSLKKGTLAYSPALKDEDVFNAIFSGVYSNDGKNTSISAGYRDCKVNIPSLEAGTYTASVTFNGNDDYAPSKAATVEYTISKASADVKVDSKVMRYNGSKAPNPITITPPVADTVKHMTVVAGLNIANGNPFIHLNIPNLIDTDSSIVNSALNTIAGKLDNQELSLSELSSLLQSAQDVLDGLQSIPGINLDTTTIKTLKSMLSAITALDGMGNVKIRVSLGKSDSEIMPSDIGLYLIGALLADPNYRTNGNLGYLVITPDGERVQLGFNMEDANGFITRQAIQNGTFDFGSHVKPGYQVPQGMADPASKLTNLFIGMTTDGVFYLDNQPSAEIGVYTQIAYIRDWGNNMYYAVPIARLYSVVPQQVKLEVISETVQYTGKPYPAKVKVDGTLVADSSNHPNLTVRYVGIDASSGGYNSTTPPTNVGVYTVTASYSSGLEAQVRSNVQNLGQLGLATGTLTIVPKNASFDVKETTERYDGTGKMIDYDNPENLEHLFIIRSKKDMSSVNLLLPKSWGITKTYTIDADAISSQLQSILGKHASDPVAAQLLDILQNRISVSKLTINGALPCEPGDYLFAGVAYGVNNGVTIDEDVLHILTELPEDDDLQDIVDSLPQTGDSSMLGLWAALAVLCSTAFIALRRRASR